MQSRHNMARGTCPPGATLSHDTEQSTKARTVELGR